MKLVVEYTEGRCGATEFLRIDGTVEQAIEAGKSRVGDARHKWRDDAEWESRVYEGKAKNKPPDLTAGEFNRGE